MRRPSLCLLAVLLGSCASEPVPSGPPPAPPRAPETAVAGASPELRRVRRQADRLLDGGAPAFRERLRELEGHPVVVNKWASWCPPCRAEVPFLRRQAERRASKVAFLGVDSQDAEAEAEAFLRQMRPGYPSYRDPDLEVAQEMRGVAAFPTTTFYDRRGELAYVKQGGYATERKLAEDIERYALRR